MDKPTSEILSLIQNDLLSFLRRIWERGQAGDHIYTVWLLIFILSIFDRIIGQADRENVLGKVYLTKSLSISLWRNLVCILIQLGRVITAEQLCPQTTDDKTDNSEGSVGGQALWL